MKIVIAGGSGYLGRNLANWLTARDHEVVVLTRGSRAGREAVRYILWDGETVRDWAAELDGADAVVNLAGRTVNCRYNATNRRDILESRLRSTGAIGQAIAQVSKPPAVWLNASSATIYRHALDRPIDERTGDIGHGFSVDVCQQWERELDDAVVTRTRRVALRSAMVFGPGEGGVFDAFRALVRRGLGGAMGNGEQYVSWIHAEDFCRAIQWLLNHDDLSGPVNLASPNPLPNREFMRILRESMGVRFGLPAARWMLEIGAFFLRTETELLLKSRRVVPGRLLKSGFTFLYPEWRDAAADILSRNSGRPPIRQESSGQRDKV